MIGMVLLIHAVGGFFIVSGFIGHVTNGWIPFILAGIVTATICAVNPPTQAPLFPSSVRYSGIGFAYNLAYSIFGGFTPALAIYLTHVTGTVFALYFVVLIGVGIGILALFLYPKKSYL